jgi:hypothetical protein
MGGGFTRRGRIGKGAERSGRSGGLAEIVTPAGATERRGERRN